VTQDASSVSVVIPHYNDLANLDRCLAELQGRPVPADTYEIVVADNNSTCDRRALEAVCAGRARLVHAPVQGAAEARNAGVRAARGTVLAFIDSDCRPEPQWLAAGVAALSKAPLVGGRVDVAVADPARLTPTEAFERVFAFNNERYVREERFSVTANLFTTRAVFDAVGGFRTGVSEDLDWGRRAAALGYAWHYAPAAAVAHPARRDWSELVRKWRRLMRESFGLAQERPGGRWRWLLRNWAMLLAVPLAALQILRSRAVFTASDRVNALGTLLRLRWWRFVEAHRLALLSH
jgi:GT2 family glycosyltransferase